MSILSPIHQDQSDSHFSSFSVLQIATSSPQVSPHIFMSSRARNIHCQQQIRDEDCEAGGQWEARSPERQWAVMTGSGDWSIIRSGPDHILITAPRSQFLSPLPGSVMTPTLCLTCYFSSKCWGIVRPQPAATHKYGAWRYNTFHDRQQVTLHFIFIFKSSIQYYLSKTLVLWCRHCIMIMQDF